VLCYSSVQLTSFGSSLSLVGTQLLKLTHHCTVQYNCFNFTA